jgi:hypothetical protein
LLTERRFHPSSTATVEPKKPASLLTSPINPFPAVYAGEELDPMADEPTLLVIR